uniref:Uncharacterized protein n=1 Tax=Magnetococcus massalia (strain MO-1) TaxID=451514 RepID=A0A1S7LMP3_MAGMO|nr:Protein of unknown function [Candidatus Magnetococcus massalia]
MRMKNLAHSLAAVHSVQNRRMGDRRRTMTRRLQCCGALFAQGDRRLPISERRCGERRDGARFVAQHVG